MLMSAKLFQGEAFNWFTESYKPKDFKWSGLTGQRIANTIIKNVSESQKTLSFSTNDMLRGASNSQKLLLKAPHSLNTRSYRPGKHDKGYAELSSETQTPEKKTIHGAKKAAECKKL